MAPISKPSILDLLYRICLDLNGIIMTNLGSGETTTLLHQASWGLGLLIPLLICFNT